VDGTTGSIELGIFDQSERDRTRASQARSGARTARPSWPFSARFLVGALLVLNILLAAFLLRTRTKGPGAPAVSTPQTLERPRGGSLPGLNAPGNSGARLGVNPGASQGVKTPAVEARPAALPSSSEKAKRPATKALGKALEASKTPRTVLPAPMPRAVVYAAHEPPAQPTAPVRDRTAASGPGAVAGQPGVAASFGVSGGGVSSAGVRGKAVPPASAPAASALAPAAIGHGLNARGTQSGSSVRVASVGLPAVEAGLVKPTMPVGRTGLKLEVIPRPVRNVENCGDDNHFIACPELKIRYDTPYTSEAPDLP